MLLNINGQSSNHIFNIGNIFPQSLHNFVMNNMLLAILGSVQQAFADHTISSFNLLSQQVNEAAIN